MEVEYKYALGGIEEIAKGDVPRSDSLDELDTSSLTSSLIVIPKIIGVYQSEKNIPELRKGLVNIMDQLAVYLQTGERELNSPDLICIAYDPTNLPEQLLREIFKDKIRRIKIARYDEIPDFYQKQVPEGLRIDDIALGSKDKNRIVVLEKNKNILELIKEDYGLTRMEAISLAAISVLLNQVKGTEIISNPFSISLGKKAIDLFDENDFNNFLGKKD